MTETEIQKAILRALEAKAIFAWRVNSGSTAAPGGRIRLAPAGTPDIVGILPGGKAFGIEVKKLGKNPTHAQMLWGERAMGLGARWGIARSVEDAMALIGDWIG